MDWRVKGVIQGLLARLPAGTQINDLLQRIAGGRANPGRHIDQTITQDWLVQMALLDGLGLRVQDQELVEIGTGWLPVFPLCFALAGARRIHTFDLHRHLRWQAVPVALRRLEKHLGALAQACKQPEADIRRRHAWLSELDHGAAILERAGIVYHAPADATATGLPAASAALVFSNSVLEHVPTDVLGPLMREAQRLLAPQGLALHSVNCGDHYAYFDRSITPIHYLRFNSPQWQRWNNDLLFQNRLRASDFTASAQGAGLVLVHQMQTLRHDLLAALGSLPIAPEFAHYSAEDLCTTSVTFAARPSPVSAGSDHAGA